MIDVSASSVGGHISVPGRRRQLVIAVLFGAVTIGWMAFLGTLFQTPGLEGPVEIAPISVVVTVLSSIGLPLVRWDNRLGYLAAVLAGFAAVGGIALYQIGAFGPTRTAPAAYLFALVGAALLITSVAAWRDRPSGRPGPSAPTSR